MSQLNSPNCVWMSARLRSGRLRKAARMSIAATDIGPPPVSRPSQNHAECGPGCVSRERTQVTSPRAPSRTAFTALRDFGV